MKPIQLLALALATSGLTAAKIQKVAGDFRVWVGSVAEVFVAEAVVAEFNRTYGYEADVAF